MEEIKIKLDVFEGPLDLLLHFIQQLELDIYDIPIAAITDQYMGYIHAMKELELEVAGEYIVMAATLMAIKSQMLLPTATYDEEIYEDYYEEDPRDALVAQLVEYKKYKTAAVTLADYAENRQQYYSKEPTDVDEYKEVPTELAANQLNTIDLFLAFHHLLEKKEKKKRFEASVVADETTIEEKIQAIEERLKTISAEGCSFDSLFTTYNKMEIVTTFMALLELMKHHKVRISQQGNYEQITIYPGARTHDILS